MKKKILFVALFLVATVASFQMGTKHERWDSLMLENIEALASGEGGMEYRCVGTGSVDCPYNHVKVYFVQIF